ncbi:hypothetical protein VTL71DRAFT_9235 [Oculimacula yallundae]|uniref:Uncharacterized protein n=1 Tax=Oculimacula yallundae TaxID=86028 RepID=A0ABR4BSI0_9HELO
MTNHKDYGVTKMDYVALKAAAAIRRPVLRVYIQERKSENKFRLSERCDSFQKNRPRHVMSSTLEIL